MASSMKRDERGDEARELNQVYARLNAFLLELLETSNSEGRPQELQDVLVEPAKKSTGLEQEKNMREGQPKIAETDRGRSGWTTVKLVLGLAGSWLLWKKLRLVFAKIAAMSV